MPSRTECPSSGCPAIAKSSYTDVFHAHYVFSRLPQIRAQILRKIDEIEQELDSLPRDLTDNPVNEVLRFIGSFQRKVRVEIDGTIYPEGLIQKIKAHLAEFRRELRGTAPRFVPFGKGTSHADDVPVLEFLDEQERDLGDEGSLDIIFISMKPNSGLRRKSMTVCRRLYFAEACSCILARSHASFRRMFLLLSSENSFVDSS